MAFDIYQIDAFTDSIFGGNPAAVCPLAEWMDVKTLQNIAAENNLSETAFFIPCPDDNADFAIRWFTPNGEVDLCGHATLAAAYVIFNHLNFNEEILRLTCRSGILNITHDGNFMNMDFPAWNIDSARLRDDVTQALGTPPDALYRGKYWMAYYNDPVALKSLTPDFKALKSIDDIDFMIATAPSDDDGYDFFSRFFCPKFNIDEDPVTGSAHCILIPFWATRLGKNNLKAKQYSPRGGHLECRTLDNNRVQIAGKAALYMQGKIYV